MTETQLAEIQEEVEKIEERVNTLTLAYQAAKTHRLALDDKLNAIVKDELRPARRSTITRASSAVW